jgi:ubiquinone/menaquinone biosynthesis C-methylase UbiE
MVPTHRGDRPRGYTSVAPYYDLVYSSKHYRRESEQVRRWVQQFRKSGGRTLLDLACGTGNHIQFLRRHFQCMGLDASEPMLRVAREKLPGVRFVRGDIRNFRLARRFDAITCLFSAIGYVGGAAALDRTVRNIARHLAPGGVAIVEPWYTPEQYHIGHAHLLSYSSPEIKIARANVARRQGRVSIMRMHYLIAVEGGSVRHLIDEHHMTLFTRAEMLRSFRRAGLKVRFFREGLSAGRGVYVAVRPRTNAKSTKG